MRRYIERYEYDAVGNFLRLIHQAANGNWTRTYAYNEASLHRTGQDEQPPEQHDRRREQHPSSRPTPTTPTAT